MGYTFVDSPLKNLEWIEDNYSLDSPLKDQVLNLKQELRFLRTYLIFMGIISAGSGKNNNIGTVEAVLRKATTDEELSAEKVAHGISYVLGIVKDFKPEIRKAYAIFGDQSRPESESSAPLVPILLMDLVDSILENLQDLLLRHSETLVEGIKEKISFLKEKLSFIRQFLVISAKPGIMPQRFLGDFLNYVRVAANRAACLSFFCWADEMDEAIECEMDVKFSDLLRKISPRTSHHIEMYVGLLRASKSMIGYDNKTIEVASFANFLLQNLGASVRYQMPSILEDLTYILTVLVDLQDDECTGDLERISADILATAREAGSFQEMNRGSILWLVQKMKLIKAEILLIKLACSEHRLMVPLKDKITALHEGLKFLTSAFSFDDHKEGRELLLQEHVKALATEVTSLIYSIHEKKSFTEKMATKTNVSLFLLLKKINLVKAETHVMELRNQNDKLLVFHMKDQIERLHEGLRFLRIFLMETGDLNAVIKDGNLLLTHIEATATNSLLLVSSFHVHQVADDISVSEFSIPLFRSLDNMTKFIKAQVLLGELQNHEHSLIIHHMKNEVDTLEQGLRFLVTFLMNPPKKYKEEGELILMKSGTLANEAASLIFSLHDNRITEDTTQEIRLVLPELVEKIVRLKGDIKRVYFQVPEDFGSNLHRIDGLVLLSNLSSSVSQLLNYIDDSIVSMKYHIEMLHQELEFLLCFLMDTAELRNEHGELQDLWECIKDIAYEAEYVIDSFLVRGDPLWYFMLWISQTMEETILIRMKITEIYDEKRFQDRVHNVTRISTNDVLSLVRFRTDNDVVALKDEVHIVIDRLLSGTKNLGMVQIVGMHGLGKTTLAQMVYNDCMVMNYFNIRLWLSLSQARGRRELLLHMLSSFTKVHHVEQSMADEDLEILFYRNLKGRRYLIVIDNLEDIQIWYDLRHTFPDDSTGSRVVITTRLHDLVFADYLCLKHCIRRLSYEESWELLQKKLFGEEKCPSIFMEVGKEISAKCNGLPYAIVTVANLLIKKLKQLDWWIQVAENLSPHLVANRDMDLLETGYNHLPNHLKPCLVYFLASSGDTKFPVRNLLWQWIAAGFIERKRSRLLEDVAEDYLLELIDRGQITFSARKSNGGVKACRVHGMVQDLCIKIAEEENFLQPITRYNEFVTHSDDLDHSIDFDHSSSSIPLKYEQGQQEPICFDGQDFITMRHYTPCVRSLQFSGSSYKRNPRLSNDISVIFENFKFLRILNLESVILTVDSFPFGLQLLVLLRYLALTGHVNYVPSTIANLWNLETFLVKGLHGNVTLPDSFWNMRRLRHVHIDGLLALSLPEYELEQSSQLLENMDSFSTPVLRYGKESEAMMRNFPKLRKLRCIFLESWDCWSGRNKFPVLDFLANLESLNISYYGRFLCSCEFSFPMNVKKLTMSNFCLPWSEISTIAKLPNLEVLKLLNRAFVGQRWEMAQGEFVNLKYLKLENLDIVQWNVDENFPRLQKLVLRRCKVLEEVPSTFALICTLETIEVHWCNDSVVDSARQILEERSGLGDENFSIIINRYEL